MGHMQALIDRVTGWAFDPAWRSTPVAGTAVACPDRRETVTLETCRSCPLLVNVRSATDVGSSVNIVMCRAPAS